MSSWKSAAAEQGRELRRKLISQHLLRWFRSSLPAMSETEREALQAGSVDWDGELYSGRPDWQRLANMSSPTLSTAERAFLDGPVDELCARVDDWEITHQRKDLSPALWQFLRQHRFFGLIIPRHYGGLEFSALAHSAVVMKIASRSLSTAITVMVPNSLGPAELLLRYGTEAQRQHYLPLLASGEELPCFALTGPSAGSDAAALPDSGVVCYGEHDGERVLGMRLNWDKRYITLAPVATVMGLAFQLRDPDHLLGDRVERGITLALIPTNTAGVTTGRRHFPARQGFQNGPTQGQDVFAPLSWIIGGEPRIGEGWRMLMECLSTGRAISLPSISIAAVHMAARNAGAYARVRRQFHTPIGYFEGIQEPLARIAAHSYAGDALRETTAAFVDLGQRPSVLSAVAKQRCTERMRAAINDAMDIFAGRAVCDGPSNPLFRNYQAIPMSITVEGANILTRCLIVFGQGAIRGHPWLLKEMEAAANPDQERGLDQFDRAVFGHIGFLLANLGRSAWYGLSGARLAPAPGIAELKPLYRRLSRLVAGFALSADAAMISLGGRLKRKEHLSGRLADVFSELYTASCVLRRYQQEGSHSADLPLAQWCVQDCLFKAQRALRDLFANLPSRPLAWLLTRIVFPWGDYARPPADTLTAQVAAILLSPSACRDRLTAGVYTGSASSNYQDDVSGRLEQALNLVSSSAAIERRVAAAQRAGSLHPGDDRIQAALDAGIIDRDEAQQLRDAAQATEAAIRVDDFAAQELSPAPADHDSSETTSGTIRIVPEAAKKPPRQQKNDHASTTLREQQPVTHLGARR